MKLTSVQERFILHWGEMGSRWGVNRTIGQIHALLYLSEQPLHAEEIAETLEVARSNVSTSLKELLSFGMVRVAHVMGDRRDHFEAQQDIWQVFKTVVEVRRRREIDPTLSMLRNELLAAPASPADARTLAKLREVHDFLEVGTAWIGEMQRLEPATLMKLLRMGAKVQQLLRGADEISAALPPP
jgi:DNA-binding transcriptional regulator GbsR (MarR family)